MMRPPTRSVSSSANESGRLRQSPHQLARRRPASPRPKSGARPDPNLAGVAYVALICEIPLRWSEIRQGDGCIRHLGARRVSARRPLLLQDRHPSPSSPHHLPPQVTGALCWAFPPAAYSWRDERAVGPTFRSSSFGVVVLPAAGAQDARLADPPRRPRYRVGGPSGRTVSNGALWPSGPGWTIDPYADAVAAPLASQPMSLAEPR